MNIGELAKELNVSGKDVIAFLQENGFSCRLLLQYARNDSFRGSPVIES